MNLMKTIALKIKVNLEVAYEPQTHPVPSNLIEPIEILMGIPQNIYIDDDDHR